MDTSNVAESKSFSSGIDSGLEAKGSNSQTDNGEHLFNDTGSTPHKHSNLEPCRDFMSGRCQRGPKCKFYHPDNTATARKRKRSYSPETGDRKNTCRDFLRNVCNRGNRCRYYHPPQGVVSDKSWFTVCKDFLNGRCARYDCRFFHFLPEDEAHFIHTGEISSHLIDQAVQKTTYMDFMFEGSNPTCKDYLNGYCNMRNCRYLHLNRVEFEDEVYRALIKEFDIYINSRGDGFPSNYARPNPMVDKSDYHNSFSRDANFQRSTWSSTDPRAMGEQDGWQSRDTIERLQTKNEALINIKKKLENELSETDIKLREARRNIMKLDDDLRTATARIAELEGQFGGEPQRLQYNGRVDYARW